jgi:transposase
MTDRQIAVMRRRIGAALEGRVPTPLRQQLTAIHLALGGQLREGAESAGVAPSTVKEWFRELQHEGIAGFLRNRQNASMNFHADLAQLQTLAIAEKNLNIRKRIMALAYVAAGVPIPDAARTTQLTIQTIYLAIRAFKRDGLASFRNKPIKPRPCKLSEAQLSELKDILRMRPQISLGDLRATIRLRFGTRYTPEGLRNMLKKQLGIVYRTAPSRWMQVEIHA